MGYEPFYRKKEYLQGMKLPNHTVNGQCSSCGECCLDFRYITEAEYREIKAFVNRNELVEQFVVGEGVDLSCPFFSKSDKECKIYEIRPFQCRQFLCSLSQEEMDVQEASLKRKSSLVSFRHQFFGNEKNLMFLLQLNEMLDTEDDQSKLL